MGALRVRWLVERNQYPAAAELITAELEAGMETPSAEYTKDQLRAMIILLPLLATFPDKNWVYYILRQVITLAYNLKCAEKNMVSYDLLEGALDAMETLDYPQKISLLEATINILASCQKLTYLEVSLLNYIINVLVGFATEEDFLELSMKLRGLRILTNPAACGSYGPQLGIVNYGLGVAYNAYGLNGAPFLENFFHMLAEAGPEMHLFLVVFDSIQLSSLMDHNQPWIDAFVIRLIDIVINIHEYFVLIMLRNI